MQATRKSAEVATKAGARTAYHHGDLPETLCRAVLEVVLEHGVGKISMSDVARRAGVSAGAPYRHFKSLDDLLVATALKVYGRFRSQQRQAIEGLLDPEDRMLTFATYFFVFAKEDPAGFALLFNSSMSVTHRELDGLSQEAFDDGMAIAMELAPHSSHELRSQFVMNVFALVYGNSKLMVERYSPVTTQGEFPHVAASGVNMLIGFLRAEDARALRVS